MDLGDAGQNSLVEWMVFFQSGKLLCGRIGRFFLHDLSQLFALLVLGDILESQGLFDGAKKSVDFVATFSELSSWSDEAFFARELAKGSTSDTLHNILKGGVRETGNDCVNVFLLFLLRDVVLLNDEGGGLRKDIHDNATDFLVGHRFVDGLLSKIVSVIGGGGVTSVDGVQLAFDVWLEVLNPVDSRDVWMAKFTKGGLLNGPLVELLDLDVQAGIGLLCGDDSIDGGVGKASTGGKGLDAGRIGVVLDETVEGVGGANGVLAGNHGHWGLGGTGINPLGDGGSDKLEDSGANGAGDDISGGDFVDNIVHVVLGVEGTVIGDGLGVLALSADLSDLVGVGLLESLDDVVHHINEDDFIASFVEELGHKATADIAAAKMNSFLSHGVFVWRN